jgi:hypothetical protein
MSRWASPYQFQADVPFNLIEAGAKQGFGNEPTDGSRRKSAFGLGSAVTHGGGDAIDPKRNSLGLSIILAVFIQMVAL